MITFQNNEGLRSQNNSTVSTLFHALQKDILQGKFRAGDKLTEQVICDKYKVSRTPVREALRQLETEGLIETIPNRGAFVVGFSAQDMSDMYALRKIYEIQAVKWAVERITESEMDELEEVFEFMEFYTQKQDVEKMLHINMRFHQLIYNASKNKMLAHILSSYQIYIKYSNIKVYHDDSYLPALLEEHRAIFEAFKSKNPLLGEDAMKKHLESSLERSSKGE